MAKTAPLLSSRLPPADPPSDFAVRALTGLRRFRIRRLRRFLVLTAAAAAAGAVYAAVSWQVLREEVSSSSFVPLLRLAVSDPDVVLAAAGDYVLGVLETLPLGALVTVLFFLLLAVCAAAAFFKIRLMQRPPFSRRTPVTR